MCILQAVNGSLGSRKAGLGRNSQGTRPGSCQPSSHSSTDKILVEEDGLHSPVTSSSCAYGSFTSDFGASITPMLGTMAVTAPGEQQ